MLCPSHFLLHTSPTVLFFLRWQQSQSLLTHYCRINKGVILAISESVSPFFTGFSKVLLDLSLPGDDGYRGSTAFLHHLKDSKGPGRMGDEDTGAGCTLLNKGRRPLSFCKIILLF